jgi:hypothetical protein
MVSEFITPKAATDYLHEAHDILARRLRQLNALFLAHPVFLFFVALAFWLYTGRIWEDAL